MISHQPSNYVCPFCTLVSGDTTQWNSPEDIVYETNSTLAYVSPKWWIHNPGHVIVIPKEHVENIYHISDGLLAEVYSTGKKIAEAMKQSYQCDGVSFRQHNEPAGNQDVWHFHVHVFPRWEGDDLYLNDNKERWVTFEEKKPYVEKLKSFFATK